MSTLFQRLAILRREVQRTQAEVELLCDAAGDHDDDLVSQLWEAAAFLKQAVEYLMPVGEHIDRDLQSTQPVTVDATAMSHVAPITAPVRLRPDPDLDTAVALDQARAVVDLLQRAAAHRAIEPPSNEESLARTLHGVRALLDKVRGALWPERQEPQARREDIVMSAEYPAQPNRE